MKCKKAKTEKNDRKGQQVFFFFFLHSWKKLILEHYFGWFLAPGHPPPFIKNVLFARGEGIIKYHLTHCYLVWNYETKSLVATRLIFLTHFQLFFSLVWSFWSLEFDFQAFLSLEWTTNILSLVPNRCVSKLNFS